MPARIPGLPVFADIATDAERLKFGHWLAGFVAGEGSFILSTSVRRGYSFCKARFAIQLRDDDGPVLEEIQAFLGCGRIYRKTHRSRLNEKPKAMFQVDPIPDLYLRVVSLFDQCPLRAKKAADFAIWRQAIKLLYDVRQRPIQSDGRRGFWSRRTEADLTAFKSFHLQLLSARVYREVADENCSRER